MGTSINNSFEKKYSTEVKLAYQQKGSKLREAVRVVTDVMGSTYDFHTMAAVIANTKSRDAEVTLLNPTQDVKTATLADAYAPIFIDKLDEAKSNASIRQGYVNTSARALGRKTDANIITAMDSSNTSISTTAGGFTYPKLLEALEGLNGADVDAEDRFIVIGEKQLSEVLNITQLTSADYQAMKNVVNGSIDRALGFNWIVSTQLNTSGSPAQRDCYAFSKSAVGLAIGSDITTSVDWVAMRVGHLVNSSMSMGAVTIEAAGVQNIPCSE